MFKIARGFGVLEKGNPYLIVSTTIWKNKFIDLERFIFVVGQDGGSIMPLPFLRTKISSRLGTLSNDSQFELAKFLEEELFLAKQYYCSWLYDQIGDRAFSQVRHAVWQESNEILPFVLMSVKGKCR